MKIFLIEKERKERERESELIELMISRHLRSSKKQMACNDKGE